MATSIRRKHNPVSDFNSAVSKLGKLPQLIKYISKNSECMDFVIVIDVGDNFCESERILFTMYSSCTRKERVEHFQKLALLCFMRYSGFDIMEKPRVDAYSTGIEVKMLGWST